MGAVYEAIDKRFDEPIALKEINFDSADEKQGAMIRKAFEREAKSLAKAKHEAVPYVRDYFAENNQQFLVMELVEGEDLGEMLKKRKAPFPVEEATDWMFQLLDALDYLHNLKPPIIHRDIKPQNLKLTARHRLKLLDFGIARSTDKTATITKQTFVGASLNYSPIEQILRVIDPTFREFIILRHKEKAETILRQDTNARCDIYSLGSTFFHLLTNHPPVDATKRILDVWEGKTDPLPNPSLLNPQIPATVSDCLLKAMEIERRKRYSSALEMQEALFIALDKVKTTSLEFRRKTSADTLVLASNPDLKVEQPTEVLSAPPTFVSPPAQVDKPDAEVTAVLLTPPPSTFPPLQSDKPNSVPTDISLTLPSDPSFEVPVAETQISLSQSSSDESTFVKFPQTQSNVSASRSDLTGVSYLEGLIDQKNTVAKIAPQTIPKVEETPSTLNNKMLWLIPIALVGFVGMSLIGGMIWMLMPSSNSAASNTAAANRISTASTATPSEGATPTPAPVETQSDTSSGSLESAPKPSSTETTSSSTSAPPKPAPAKQPVEKPVEKPAPVERTVDEKPAPAKPAPAKPASAKPAPAKPTPAKSAQDPRCVLTNSCQ